MSSVYIVKDDGKSIPMVRVRCRDEEKELQQLLESNPQLMPGDQIRPDDPCRWLLIKREMPVPDPSSGEDRWSIDHFFVDQTAIPTFVECKRYLDTRSRREVVGQMLDYAANGHWYWDRDTIREYAVQTAKEQGVDLEDSLQLLSPENSGGIDDFFNQVENNLREGQIRMIFFMEEAPQELKSIVDFLNKQMERSEILIVEASQFESGGLKVVSPSLFGFTEQARRIKKIVTVRSGSDRKQWNESLFFEEAQRQLIPEHVQAIMNFYVFAKSYPLTVRWGSGKVDGSLNFVAEDLCPRSIISISSKGTFYLTFGYMYGSTEVDNFRNELARLMGEKVGFILPVEIQGKHPGFKISEWADKTPLIIETLTLLLDSVEHQRKDT